MGETPLEASPEPKQAVTASPAVSARPVRGIQIACFDLCQNLGMEIEEAGRRITAQAVHFPATYEQIKANLEALKRFSHQALLVLAGVKVKWDERE